MAIDDNINGILVGCDDYACDFDNKVGGYCWIIKCKDWNNKSTSITHKIYEYENKKNFHIYFYVYEYKNRPKKIYRFRKGEKPKYRPAKDSAEYRNKIFGFANVVNVTKNKYTNGYKHEIEIEKLRIFSPKIKFNEVKNQLEYIYWTEKQKEMDFSFILRSNGLYLTKKDCEFLQSFNHLDFVD